MMAKKVCIKTVGCRTNRADSALIRGLLSEMGYTFTEREEEADIVIVNSCAVTSKAERDTRRFIYSARRKSPSAKIVLTGCMAQVYPEEGVEAGANLVLGLNERDRIGEFIDREGVFVSEPLTIRTGTMSFDGTRAFLKIQEGCEHFCTYCIVPYARGKSRSLDEDEIVKVVKELENAAYREVVLCGTNLGMFGENKTSLPRAIEKVLNSTSVIRIRLSSVEPFYINKELIDVINESERVAKHLHIPVQSASDRVLSAMGRGYRFYEFKKIVDDIKEKNEFLCIGTDIIVGFPTEGEEEFKETVRNLEGLNVDYFHVFSYSPRKGTRAYAYKSQVPEREKKARTKLLIQMGEEKRQSFIRKNIGRIEKVLIEKNLKKFSEGLSGNYIRVYVEGSLKENEFYDVLITGENNGRAEGKIA